MRLEAVTLPPIAPTALRRALRVNEIQILNSFGKQGWVFESPAQCPQIVQTPLNKVRLAIAVHTHLFSN